MWFLCGHTCPTSYTLHMYRAEIPTACEKEKGNLNLSLESSITKELKVDQSLCHNVVCLTVVDIENDVIFDSRPPRMNGKVMLQHFYGVEVETKMPVFDDSKAILMDFGSQTGAKLVPKSIKNRCQLRKAIF